MPHSLTKHQLLRNYNIFVPWPTVQEKSGELDLRVLERLDVTTHRHFHSDHGHLDASDSLVPIIFVRGGQEGREALSAICNASLVDVTPTILDVLGLLPSCNATLKNRPAEMKGHSLTHVIDRIVTKSHPTDGENICDSLIIALPRKPHYRDADKIGVIDPRRFCY
jgi:hypothetical protein